MHDLTNEPEEVRRAYQWLREAADEDPATTNHDALWNARAMAAYAKQEQRGKVSIEEYCETLRTWLRCLQSGPSAGRYAELISACRTVQMAISKSSLLARLMYGREKLRTEQCPKHKGVWSGLPSPGNECECQLTGWLPAGDRS